MHLKCNDACIVFAGFVMQIVHFHEGQLSLVKSEFSRGRFLSAQHSVLSDINIFMSGYTQIGVDYVHKE